MRYQEVQRPGSTLLAVRTARGEAVAMHHRTGSPRLEVAKRRLESLPDDASDESITWAIEAPERLSLEDFWNPELLRHKTRDLSRDEVALQTAVAMLEFREDS